MRPARSVPIGVLGSIRGAAIRLRRASRRIGPRAAAGAARAWQAPLTAAITSVRRVRRSEGLAHFADALGRATVSRARGRRSSAAAARIIVREIEDDRQIGLSLYAGPAQQLSLALLRIDALEEGTTSVAPGLRGGGLELVSQAVTDGLAELRAIASSIRTPDLDALDAAGVVGRAVRDRLRHGPLAISVDVDEHLPDVSLAAKIVVYQCVRGLLGAFADDPRTSVKLGLSSDDGILRLSALADGHAALSTWDSEGVRERAELLGGFVCVRQAPTGAMTLEAALPVRSVEDTGRSA